MSPHTASHSTAGTLSTGWRVPVSLTSRRVEESSVDPEPFTIDCADCAHRDTPVCDDCVVSFLVGHPPGEAVVVDADEARAVRLLEKAGLVPGVRHQQKAS